MKNYAQIARMYEQGIDNATISLLTDVPTDELNIIISNIDLESDMKVQGASRYMERQDALKAKGKDMETDNSMSKIKMMLKPMIKEIREIADAPDTTGKRSIIKEVFRSYDADYLSLLTLRVCLMSITTSRPELTAMTGRMINYLNVDDELDIKESIRVGMKLIDIFCRNSDGCFERVKTPNIKGHAVHSLAVTEKFQQWEIDNREFMADMAVMYRPMVVPPKPWTGIKSGGYWDDKLQQRFVRHNKKATNKTHGYNKIPRVYEAVNKIQATPFAINTFVLDVANELYDEALDYLEDIEHDVDNVPPCFFPKFMQTLPERPFKERVSALQKEQVKLEAKLGITEESRSEHGKGFGAWVRDLLSKIVDGKQYKDKKKLEEIRDKILQLVKWQKEVTSRTSKNRILTIALDVANKYQHYPAIYFPCNLDWRGRVYPIPSGLTTQGVNLQKALLKFNKGKPIGSEEALYWLMVHTANTFGMDKASWQDRLEWTAANKELIQRVAQDPIGNITDWNHTDEPWLFLAACEQMCKYYEHGLNAVVDIPIPMDGTCNGAQHYAAMSRDLNGAYGVNVAPNGTAGLQQRLNKLRNKLNIGNRTQSAFEDGKEYLSIETNRKMKEQIKETTND